MSLKKYLILMGISTLFCWIAFMIVVFFIDPHEAGTAGFIFFYSSLFLALVGSFAILGFLFRLVFKKNSLIFKDVNISSRQAFFYSSIVIVSLLMQSRRLLTWWNALILIGLFALMEFFFISYKKANK